MCKLSPTGQWLVGIVHDIKASPVLFSGRRWHATEPWVGDFRWVISAFTPRDVSKITEKDRVVLRELGFPEETGNYGEVCSPDPGKLTRFMSAGEDDKPSGGDLGWEIGLPQPLF